LTPATFAACPTQTQLLRLRRYAVVAITDGDTLTLLDANPERGQAFGQAAARRLNAPFSKRA